MTHNRLLRPSLRTLTHLAAALALPLLATAQTDPNVTWDRTFGGSAFETVRVVRPTADGGFAIAGSSPSGVSGNKTSGTGLQMWIVKVDASGAKQWERSVNPGEAFLFGFDTTSDGGFILAGRAASASWNFVSTGVAVKLDSAGIVQWTRAYATVSGEFRAARQTADGGFVFAGHINNAAGGNDGWVVKTDAAGNPTWEQRLGGSDDDSFETIAPTADGGYLVAGPSRSTLSGHRTVARRSTPDWWFARLNSTGAKQWDVAYGGLATHELGEIQQTRDGGFIVVGRGTFNAATGAAANNGSDSQLLKLDPAGALVWQHSMGNPNRALTAHSVQQTRDDGYLIAASGTLSLTAARLARSDIDAVLIKVNSAGQRQWFYEVGGSGNETYAHARELADGTYIVGATSNSPVSFAKTTPNYGSSDYWLVRLASTIGGSTGGGGTDPVTPASSRIVNLSVRTRAGIGNPLIVGFAIGGAGTAGTKTVLLRGIGPSLAAFGVQGTLANPFLLLSSGTSSIASNDNWGGGTALAATFGAVGAFPLAANSLDSALSTTLNRDSYTAQVATALPGDGVALAEVYDLTAESAMTATTARLINISARAQAGSGADALIAGFVISGTGPKTVLVRGIGPSLTQFGVPGAMADPQVEIVRDGRVVASNQDWGGAAALATAFESVAAFRLENNTRDAALVVTLEPGPYTANVTGNNNTTGAALVEVYELR